MRTLPHGHRAGPGGDEIEAQEGLSSIGWDLVEITRRSRARSFGAEGTCRLADQDRLNVNGSGISLGHPIGATGVRIMTTLLHEMRRRAARYGLETMCIGGGQGVAAIFERA